MLNIIKTVVYVMTLLLLPSISNADNKVDNKTDIFKKECVKAWMGAAGDKPDMVQYQNLGEKYCGCAAGQPLATEEDITKATHLCMAQTILHDTVDGMEDSGGLSTLTPELLQKGCQDKWKVIFPAMNDRLTTVSTAYCQCAAPKIIDMKSKSDNLTDEQWNQNINQIAVACMGILATEKPVAENPPADNKTAP